MNKDQLTRRQLIVRVGAAAAGTLITRSGFAEENRLSTEDPAAAGLGYVESGESVDTTKYPKYQTGQQCSTCALFQGGEEAWGKCGIFPGKVVKATGWCNAWVKG